MTLLIDVRDGVAVVEVPDADGLAHPYGFRPLCCGSGTLWLAELWRLDGQGRHYRVWLSASGFWGCECPDRQVRWRKKRTCKHVEAARDLVAFVPPLVDSPAHKFAWRCLQSLSVLAKQNDETTGGETPYVNHRTEDHATQPEHC